jgi:hypothetical protein
MPAVLAFGLLASLLAHVGLYGGEHSMGGAYNELFVELAAAGCGAFAAFLGGLAWAGARRSADGSILAAHLRARLPHVAPLTASATLWFALGERIEPAHSGVGTFVTLACLFAASWLLLRVVRWAVALLADAIVAVVRSPFADRIPIRTRQFRPTPTVRRSPLLRRRFARPPPIVSIGA